MGQQAKLACVDYRVIFQYLTTEKHILGSRCQLETEAFSWALLAQNTGKGTKNVTISYLESETLSLLINF